MLRTAEVISAASNSALRSRFGGLVNGPRNAAKEALGLYFDLFMGEYRTDGLTFAIPRDLTSRGLRGKFITGTYELPERTLVAKHLHPDAHVLELGGSLGIVSCHVNRRLADRQAHVVLEPNAALIPWLTRNRDQNSCGFTIENRIMGSGGAAMLQKSKNSDSGRIVSTNATGASASLSDADVQYVETVSWDALERANHLSFDTLIADIEGAEYALLRDFPSEIERLKTIIMEMHPRIVGPQKMSEVVAWLDGLGFRLADEMLDTQVWLKR